MTLEDSKAYLVWCRENGVRALKIQVRERLVSGKMEHVIESLEAAIDPGPIRIPGPTVVTETKAKQTGPLPYTPEDLFGAVDPQLINKDLALDPEESVD